MKTPSPRLIAFSLFFIGTTLIVREAQAQRTIQYLSSSTGYVLHRSGNTAVVSQWQGQKPIANFTGYGQIMMDNMCLTGNNGEQPLTWEPCRNDPGQRWGIDNGRLRNERGWCADLEGGRNGANVRVLAWKCHGGDNQRWKSHYVESANDYISKIPDASIRNSLNLKISKATAGQLVPLTKMEEEALMKVGGNKVIQFPPDWFKKELGGGGKLISDGGNRLIGAGAWN
jgi:hypothetical protein